MSYFRDSRCTQVDYIYGTNISPPDPSKWVEVYWLDDETEDGFPCIGAIYVNGILDYCWMDRGNTEDPVPEELKAQIPIRYDDVDITNANWCEDNVTKELNNLFE